MYKPYRFRTLIWDIFMLCLTGGLWVFWIPIREISRSSKRNNGYGVAVVTDNRRYYS